MGVDIGTVIADGYRGRLQQGVAVADTFQADVEGLFETLEQAGVAYTLVGGMALLLYVAGRNTVDLDLIVSPETIPVLPWNGEVLDRDFGRARFGAVHIVLLLTSNLLFEQVQREERVLRQTESRVVPCATPRGLLLLKLYALPSLYRQGNLQRAALYETDIRMLLLHAPEVTDEGLLNTLVPYVLPGDLQELAQILREQRGRRRFQ
jgi:hypothetical protein